MRIATVYSHLNGLEWLKVHRPGMWEEIERIIKRIKAADYKTKVSKEKTMKGRMVYAPIELNARLKKDLGKAGWGEQRTNYWVTDDVELIRQVMELTPAEQKAEIEAVGKRPIKSFNQTDFVKDRVAVEVQLAKYSFIPYDIFVKHTAFYIGGQIDVGIEIVPTKAMQEQMSSGPGYFEKALHEIARQGRGVPAVPLVLVGVEP